MQFVGAKGFAYVIALLRGFIYQLSVLNVKFVKHMMKLISFHEIKEYQVGKFMNSFMDYVKLKKEDRSCQMLKVLIEDFLRSFIHNLNFILNQAILTRQNNICLFD